MFFNVPTLCMLSIKTLSVGSTVFVNQMVPHTSTSSCLIDLRNQSTNCPLQESPHAAIYTESDQEELEVR